MKNILKNKRSRNLIEILIFLIIPFFIFIFITLRNKNKIEHTEEQKTIVNQELSEQDNLIKQGLFYLNQKQFEKSIEIHLKILAINPNHSTAHNNIGFAYGNLKKWDNGISHCLKALESNPNFQLAKNNLNWMQNEKLKEAK